VTNPGDREETAENTGSQLPSPDQEQAREERAAWSAGVVTILLLIALAAAGIVIGLGSGSLAVDSGIAQTTDLQADWECSWTNDDGLTTDCGGFGDEPAGDNALDPDNYDWPLFNSWDHPRKDVGECLASIPVADPTKDDQVATVTIGNAYPSYECTFTLVISNTGTVPFTIAGYSDDVVPPLELLNDTCTTTEELGGTAGTGVELDVGEKGSIECTIHIMEEAQQVHQYAFTIGACSVPCDSSIIQQLGIFGWPRGAPAALGLSIASETR